MLIILGVRPNGPIVCPWACKWGAIKEEAEAITQPRTTAAQSLEEDIDDPPGSLVEPRLNCPRERDSRFGRFPLFMASKHKLVIPEQFDRGVSFSNHVTESSCGDCS